MSIQYEEYHMSWASDVYTRPSDFNDIELKLAYYILSGHSFDDESLDEWAASVYNETMGRTRTPEDVAIAHDILRARFNRHIDKST